MIFSIVALSVPTVSVRAEGSAVAGSTNYSLVCDITIPTQELHSDVTPTITFQWTLPSGNFSVYPTLTNRDHNYYSRLPFTFLTHNNEGDYMCNAYSEVNGARSPTAVYTYRVTLGKYYFIMKFIHVSRHTLFRYH